MDILSEKEWGVIERILAISDIHGCYDELNRLLEKVNYSSSDQLILVEIILIEVKKILKH